MQTVQRYKNIGWIALVVLAFLIVYLMSWTPVYVEGDDAASILYHATGEHVPNLGAYSPYQSGMDIVLHFLPANEAVLRPVGMAITATAAVLTPILMYLLAFDWLGEDAVKRRWLSTILILLATPEFFYLGLVYLPSMVAICGVLTAHLVLRRTLRAHWASPEPSLWRRPGVYGAILLYALGALCRWDIATYGAVIAADIFIGMPHGAESWTATLRQRVIFAVTWGVLALAALVVAMWISGYSPAAALAMTGVAFGRVSDTGGNIGYSGSVVEGLGGQLVYFTPVALLLIVVGAAILISRRSRLLLPIVVGIIVVLPWIKGGAPKFLLPALPGMTICLVLGFEMLWWKIQQPTLKNVVRVALVVGIAAIWLIGVQVDTDSSWGPGFGLRDFDRPVADNGPKLTIGLRAGLSLPLSEGPRALFGHAYVLLGGQWRSLVTMLANEQEQAARTAVDKNLPMLRFDWHKLGLISYVKLGYTITSDDTDEALITRWNLVNGSSKAVVWGQVDPEMLYHKADVEKLLQITNQETVVLVGYASDMRKLYLLNPTSFEKLGPTSAVLNLKTLSQTLQ